MQKTSRRQKENQQKVEKISYNVDEAVNYIDSKFDNLVPGILRTI